MPSPTAYCLREAAVGSVSPAMRSAGAGANTCTGATSSAANCRSSARPSVIQNDRPWVAAIRSSPRIARSWMGATGRLRLNGSQDAPSSQETNRPRSVPAYSSPERTGSSRMTRVKSSAGRLPVICVQVAP